MCTVQTTEQSDSSRVRLFQLKSTKSRPEASAIYLKATVTQPPVREVWESEEQQSEATISFTPDELQQFVEQVSLQAAIRGLQAQHQFNVHQGKSSNRALTALIRSMTQEFTEYYRNQLIQDLKRLPETTTDGVTIVPVQTSLSQVFLQKPNKRRPNKVTMKPRSRHYSKQKGGQENG